MKVLASLLFALPLFANAQITYSANAPEPTVALQVNVTVTLRKLTFQVKDGQPDAQSVIVCSNTAQAPLYDLTDPKFANGYKSPVEATIAECSVDMKGKPTKYSVKADMTIVSRAGKTFKQGLVSIVGLGAPGEQPTYQWGNVSTESLNEKSLGTYVADFSLLDMSGQKEERVSAEVEFNDP